MNLGIGTAAVTAVMGYCVVFFGLVLLMLVIMIMGKIMVASQNKQKAAAAAVAEAPVETAPAAPKPEAPGSAGEVKLYNVEPRDAAMIMAIVADKMGKPLNELRFISIKEVTGDEV